MTDDTTDLPPVLAFADVLDRIERATDDDAAQEWLAEVREGQVALAERPPARRESAVADLENVVESLRTHLADGSDADWWAETVQNRLRTYRRTEAAASDTLSLSRPRLETDGQPVDVATDTGEATLTGTLVNGGERADATIQLAFYDEDGRPVWIVESRQFGLDPGERRGFELTVYVPEEVAYYATAALDVNDPQAVAGDAPTTDG